MKKVTSINLAKYPGMTQDELNEELADSCKRGNLEEVRFLLTSPKLKEHADISYEDYSSLIFAYRFEHLEVFKYLLTSPELKEHADVHAREDYCLRTACTDGSLEFVKYILTAPELKSNIDIHTQHDVCFRTATLHETTNVLKYLIFDFNIEKTDDIKEFLSFHSAVNPFAAKVSRMFEMRDMNAKLEQELPTNIFKIKKAKL